MSDKAIVIKELHKIYKGGFEALKGINIEIKKGEFFGLLGPNGASKTTMINILTGLSIKTSGSVSVFGKDVVEDYMKTRSVIGVSSQEFNIDEYFSVYKTLWYQAGYYGIPENKRSKLIDEVLEIMSLMDKKYTAVHHLSGGMKRRLMLAKAVIHKPKILILDEPTAGVDLSQRYDLWNYLRKLKKEGVTILLTTHYIEEAEKLCERVAILNYGKVVSIGRTKTLLNKSGKEKLEDLFVEVTKDGK